MVDIKYGSPMGNDCFGPDVDALSAPDPYIIADHSLAANPDAAFAATFKYRTFLDIYIRFQQNLPLFLDAKGHTSLQENKTPHFQTAAIPQNFPKIAQDESQFSANCQGTRPLFELTYLLG